MGIADLFPKVLRQERKKLHKTQKQIADEIGYCYQSIHFYESKKYIPDLELAEKLLDTVGCELVIRRKKYEA